MKLHLWAATVAGGILSAVGLAVAAILFKVTGGSAQIILRAYDGLCPVYEPHTGVGNLIIGLILALIEGAIIGLVVAVVYNYCVDLLSKKAETKPGA